MPLYDYRCPRCDYRFEVLQRAGAAAPECPACHAATERCVSAPAPPGRSKAIVASARRRAARDGHFSHYSKAERRKAGA